MDARAAVALRHIDLTGRGLEVGPAYSPLVPKASGLRVEIVDHASRADLVRKYAELGVDQAKLDLIETVDYFWTEGRLADAVGGYGEYDYIVAGHVIEHTIDLVEFLSDCAVLLKPAGRLALVVPDKRMCFDRFKALTSVGAVVDAHLRPTRFHPSGVLLDHLAYDCLLDGQNSWWAGKSGELTTSYQNLEPGPTVIKRGFDQEHYYDSHRWIFTPSSFKLLIDDLAELHYQPFRVIRSSPTRGFEFYVTLSKEPEPVDRSPRIKRLLRIELELGGLEEHAARLEDLTTELGEARAEVEALRASTSWRVTAPLRAITGRLRH